jgi:hypothetical protein
MERVCVSLCVHECVCARLSVCAYIFRPLVLCVHSWIHSTSGRRWSQTLSPRPSARLRVSNLILSMRLSLCLSIFLSLCITICLSLCLTICRAGHNFPGLRGPSSRVLACCVPGTDATAGCSRYSRYSRYTSRWARERDAERKRKRKRKRK